MTITSEAKFELNVDTSIICWEISATEEKKNYPFLLIRAFIQAAENESPGLLL